MFHDQVKEYIESVLGKTIELATPPDPKLGDYAIPCFPFAKELKSAPAKIASDFKSKLTDLPQYIEKIETAGPYLNVFLNKTEVAKRVFAHIQSEKGTYGTSKTGNGSTVIIEYASPNTNKPLHLGHVRNICTGASLSNIYKAHGHNVVRANIVNDRGIHICKAMLAYALYGKGATPESTNRKPDHFVGDYYVRYATEVKNNPALVDEAKELLQKWEAGDKQTRELWKHLREWCEEGFAQTYESLQVGFDRIDYESDIWTNGREIVNQGVKSSAFIKDETGAVIAPLSKHAKLPDKVLLRSDGTALYMTQDLYLAMTRHEDTNFSQLIYVVGSEQNLHFAQLFKILELLGNEWAKNCFHYSYGMVYLPEGKMKSREGIVVDADDIIHHMGDLARSEIANRQSDLEEQELHERAHAVGLAALKFMMLKIDSVKDITFDPNESISFEGDTGPYLQYTHARAASILRNDPQSASTPTFDKLSPVERELVMLISQYPEVSLSAYHHKRPHLVAQYLLGLAQKFNEFYHSKPVLKEADMQVRADRVALVRMTKQTIANALQLLGIQAIEQM